MGGGGGVTGSLIVGAVGLCTLCKASRMNPSTEEYLFELPKLLTHSACQTRPGSEQMTIDWDREESVEGIEANPMQG